MGQLSVTFRPSPVNAWFCRLFAKPFVRVDSVTQECSWTTSTTVDVEAGTHRVETFIRYRRQGRDLGLGEGTFSVPDGDVVHIVTANTWANQSAFMPRLGSGG